MKLIACDLDGTLLQNLVSKCSEEVFPLIEALSDRGVLFVPASGRQYPNLRRLFAPVKDRLMYICENGALVFYQDRVIFKKQFTDEVALELSHAIMEHPLCDLMVDGERVSYLIPKTPDFISLMRDDVGNDVAVVQRPEDVDEPIIKVSFYTTPEDQEEATNDLRGLCHGQCIMVTSGNQWVDFAPLGTSKGAALEAIGREFQIGAEDMVAFGDNENDRAMLEFVGQPYLMDNSNPSIFDIPGKRCTRVEDTLRGFLEQWDDAD